MQDLQNHRCIAESFDNRFPLRPFKLSRVSTKKFHPTKDKKYDLPPLPFFFFHVLLHQKLRPISKNNNTTSKFNHSSPAILDTKNLTTSENRNNMLLEFYFFDSEVHERKTS